MKKFLTVLLVIAVMFTFSFSSAFAAVNWTGEATSKYLTEVGDYDLNGTTATTPKGTEGITEAYRAKLLADVAALETLVKAGTGEYAYYAPEKAEALKVISTYKDAVKAAKTAKEADALMTALGNEAVAASALGAIKESDEVLAAAKVEMPLGIEVYVDFTRLVDRYGTNVDFYLPGYGVIPKAKIVNEGEKYYFGYGSKYTVGQVLATTGAEGKFMAKWLMDNNYRTASDAKDGAAALVAALVPITEAYTKSVVAERDAIQDEIYKYVDKAAVTGLHGAGGLTVSDLEGLDALAEKITDFDAKGATVPAFKSEAELKAAIKKVAETYFDQYCAEVSAIPEVKKLTATDKAKVLELKNKVDALSDSYENAWDYAGVTITDNTYAHNYTGLVAAYKYFLAEDVAAFKKLDKFSELEKVGGTAYFDASEKNVTALKAKRAAYDALVADYGYADLQANAAGDMGYTPAAAAEAQILAAENNLAADAGYEVKDNSKVQAYLNNATVKVTTKALGNKKVRVQATVDTASFEKILDAMDEGFDVSYQFYYKKAANTTYKAGKVKDVNYTTFKLTKGVKYNFQCKVVIKDANGNVVATKDYKASTVGTRTVK